jgi:hypothetical protein
VVGKISFLVTLLVVLAACSSSATNESLPVLVMDDAHFQLEAIYQIPAGTGFILDSKNYKFQIPANSGPLVANYMQLKDVAKDGQFYGMELQPDATSNTITVDKLQPLSATEPLKSFRSGQTVVVAVGNMAEGHFVPLWTATIAFK